jgi:hypothetical protein
MNTATIDTTEVTTTETRMTPEYRKSFLRLANSARRLSATLYPMDAEGNRKMLSVDKADVEWKDRQAVTINYGKWTCTCKGYRQNGKHCMHLLCAYYMFAYFAAEEGTEAGQDGKEYDGVISTLHMTY